MLYHMTDNMADLCKKVKDQLSYLLYAITYGQKGVLSIIWGISTEWLWSEEPDIDKIMCWEMNTDKQTNKQTHGHTECSFFL